MSHELRTPLNAVLGFSEVLLERMFGDINERQEEYLRDIHGSGKHLLELLNEILDLSKVEAGRMELEYSLVRACPPCWRTPPRCCASARPHTAIDLRVEVGDGRRRGGRPTSCGFKQVVLNLVTQRGEVHRRTAGPSWCGPREVADELAGHRSTDTGIGIPETDRERIFESFQQGGRGASREEGTGLGLTLSRRIVELLGGRMWLESEVGVGSTFGFAFPARRARSEAPGAAAADRARPPSSSSRTTGRRSTC